MEVDSILQLRPLDVRSRKHPRETKNKIYLCKATPLFMVFSIMQGLCRDGVEGAVLESGL